MSSPVVHFHVMAADPVRAGRFYEELFAWHIRPANLSDVPTGTRAPYRFIDAEDAGLSGSVSDRRLYRATSAEFPNHGGVVLVIEVEDLDRTLDMAEYLGAHRLSGPRDRLVLQGSGDEDGPFELDGFVDPEGNLVELIRR